MIYRLSFSFLFVFVVTGCGQHTNTDTTHHDTVEATQMDLDTYDGVVADIVAKANEQTKTELRKIAKKDLIRFYLTWGKDIRNHYKLWENEKLRKSCAKHLGKDGDMDAEDASMVIMEGVWLALQ
jgi:hypothetical protein